LLACRTAALLAVAAAAEWLECRERSRLRVSRPCCDVVPEHLEQVGGGANGEYSWGSKGDHCALKCSFSCFSLS